MLEIIKKAKNAIIGEATPEIIPEVNSEIIQEAQEVPEIIDTPVPYIIPSVVDGQLIDLLGTITYNYVEGSKLVRILIDQEDGDKKLEFRYFKAK